MAWRASPISYLTQGVAPEVTASDVMVASDGVSLAVDVSLSDPVQGDEDPWCDPVGSPPRLVARGAGVPSARSERICLRPTPEGGTWSWGSGG